MANTGLVSTKPTRKGMTRGQAPFTSTQKSHHNNCDDDLECDGSGLCGLKFRNDVLKAHMCKYRISVQVAEEVHAWIENAGVRYYLKAFKGEELDDIKNHGLLLLTLGNANSIEKVLKVADEIADLSVGILRGGLGAEGGPTKRQLFRIAKTVAGIASMGSVPGASWHGPEATKGRTTWEHKTAACLLISMVMDLHRSTGGYFAGLLGDIKTSEYWKVYPIVETSAIVTQEKEAEEVGSDDEDDQPSRSSTKNAVNGPASLTFAKKGGQQEESMQLEGLEKSDNEVALAPADAEAKSKGTDEGEDGEHRAKGEEVASAGAKRSSEEMISTARGSALDSQDIGEPSRKKPRVAAATTPMSATAADKQQDLPDQTPVLSSSDSKTPHAKGAEGPARTKLKPLGKSRRGGGVLVKGDAAKVRQKQFGKVEKAAGAQAASSPVGGKGAEEAVENDEDARYQGEGKLRGRKLSKLE